MLAKCSLVVLISGRGTNLQAILDGASDGDLPVTISSVISNRPGVQGLQRAEAAGIPYEIVDHRQFSDRLAFDRALAASIDRHQPDLVVLAGFMRILSSEFVEHYHGRMLNIHPSLLPKYRGLHTHQRALAAGDAKHGASVHFVTPELDGGPVLLQAEVPVLPGDDPDTLAARVLQQEHRLYPQAIRWFAEGRVELRDGGIWFDGRPCAAPFLLADLRSDK